MSNSRRIVNHHYTSQKPTGPRSRTVFDVTKPKTKSKPKPEQKPKEDVIAEDEVKVVDKDSSV